MNTVLTVVGVLALGALIISAFVFAGAARRYMNGESRREHRDALDSDLSPYRRAWVERSPRDRRGDEQPQRFPLELDGIRIEVDRRINRDRRRAA